MDPAFARDIAPAKALFQDGLGERFATTDRTRNDAAEMLCLRSALTAVPAFEFALRERVSSLAGFRHACYRQVRTVERLTDTPSTLALVSDATDGVRLSELIATAERDQISLDIETALCLLRQLVPAIVMLHENAPDAAHGAIAAERIIVTPSARIVVVEHVLGSALEQLRWTPDRYWSELRVAVTRAAGPIRFDQRTDVVGLGTVALSLILGRTLRDDEPPSKLQPVVASAWAVSARGGLEPLPAGLRNWLMSALQLDPKRAFATAADAQAELEAVLGESEYLAAPARLEAFLARCRARMNPPAPSRVEGPAPSRVEGPAPNRVERPAPSMVEAPVVKAEAPPAQVDAPAIVVAPPPVHKEPERAATVQKPAAVPIQPPFQAPMPAPVAASRIAVEAPSRRAFRRLRWPAAAAAGALIAAAGAGVVAARRTTPVAVTDVNASRGTLVVNTNPVGAKVFVDGTERGVTPMSVSLSAGSHALELRGDGATRAMSLVMTAGAQVAQYIELPKTASGPGQLLVRTEPAGARVVIDGLLRGVSPITVGDLQPGEHAVLLESDVRSVKQTVTVEAGVTGSLVVPLAAPEGTFASGWVAISAPTDVQILESGRLIGTSQSDRVMVSAGKHDLELVNETLGYRATRTVQVAAGKVTPIKIEFPQGSIALNALPWAEVWMDGTRVGETPIGNLALPVGPHEFVFRHPELGEQRHAITVTLKAPARLSVDLRKK